MDTYNIVINDEVLETTEEIVKANFGKGLKIAAGVELAVLVALTGVFVYKYVAKPMLAKIKAQNEHMTAAEFARAYRG